MARSDIVGCGLSLVAMSMAVCAGATVPDDRSIARTQLEVARQVRGEADLIVAVVPRSVVPEEPHAPPFRMQNFTVAGSVSRCFKGRMPRPATVSYVVTAEGRPAALNRPHIAFLRRAGGRWTAVDGPMFRDSTPMRAGLARMTHGCVR